MKMKKKIVFLDRDGTLIEEVNFLSTVEETNLYSFTIQALSLLSDAGFTFVVTTNQSGVARGYFGAEEVNAIHDEIQRLLKPMGLAIESFQFCPHFPDAGCECRKPGTGMIQSATNGQTIELSECWVIGDKKLDIEMGFNAGTKTALVLTGYGEDHQLELDRQPDVIASNLLVAAEAIVKGTANAGKSAG